MSTTFAPVPAAAAKKSQPAAACPAPVQPAPQGLREIGLLQRKCACGGSCPACREEEAVQTKLAVGAPNDKYEQEAERVADQVMRLPEDQVRRQPDEETPGLTVQRRTAPPAPVFVDLRVQRLPSGRTPEVTPPLAARIDAIRGGGALLPDSVRGFFEPRFGRGFSQIRVHDNERAAAVASSLKAQAFTVGNDLFFGQGKFDGRSVSGRHLLAHELTHSIQQTGGAPRRVQRAEDEAAEEEESYGAGDGGSVPSNCTPDIRGCDSGPLPENPGWPTSPLLNHPRLHQAFRNTPTLKWNPYARREAVGRIQEALLRLCYPLPISTKKSGQPDQRFGDETKAAVKQFQRDQCIKDDGKVGHDTLTAMDWLLSRPEISLKSLSFDNEHRLLLDNTSDWGHGGSFYAMVGQPHVAFEDSAGWYSGAGVPMTVTAGETMVGTLEIGVRGGAPGVSFALRGDQSGGDQSFSFEGTGTVTGTVAEESRSLHIRARAPLDALVTHSKDLHILWYVTSLGREKPLGVSLSHETFVTAHRPHEPGKNKGDRLPNWPTYKRMMKAVGFAEGLSPDSVDKAAANVMKDYPDYGEASPHEIWEISDHPFGFFQCIAIANYLEAVLNVLGYTAPQTTSAKSVVVFAADPGDGMCEGKEQVQEAPNPGMSAHPIFGRHGREGWSAFLIDHPGRANNFEACVLLKWRNNLGVDVTQYFCGGAPNPDRPDGDFLNARDVLHASFSCLAYVVAPPVPPWVPVPTENFHRIVVHYKKSYCPKKPKDIC